MEENKDIDGVFVQNKVEEEIFQVEEGETGNVSKEIISHKIPEYALETIVGKNRQNDMISSMGLSDADGRKEWMFNQICKYINMNKNGAFFVDDMVRYLVDNTNFIKGISKIKVVLKDTVEVLGRDNYCELVYQEDEILKVIMIDPVFKVMSDFFGKYYGRDKGMDYKYSQFLVNGVFLNLQFLVKKFNMTIMEIEKIILSLSMIDFSCGKYPAKTLAEILKINLSEDEKEYFLWNKKDSFQLFLKNTVIPFFKAVISSNPAIKTSFYEKKVKLDSKISNLSKWFPQFYLTIKDAKKGNRKYLDTKFVSKFKVSGDKIGDFILKLCVLVDAYYTSLIKEEKRKDNEKKDNEEKIKDFKRKIIEDFPDSKYELFSIEHLQSIPIEEGKMLGNIITFQSLKENLLKNDGIPFEAFTGEGGLKFYGQYRIVETAINEVHKERERLKKIVITKFQFKSNAPKAEEIISLIKKNISPEITVFLGHIFEKIVKKKTNLMGKIFPSLGQIQKYDLKSYYWSDESAKKKKVDYLLHIFFEKGNMDIPKSHFDILFTDDDINQLISETKSEVKMTQKLSTHNHNKNIDYSLIDVLLFPITFVLGLFGLGKKNKKATKQKNKKISELMKTKNSKKKTMEYPAVKKKFNLQFESKKELGKALDDLEKDWNKVIIDPNRLVPNWNKLNMAERGAKKGVIDEYISKTEKENRDTIVKKIQKSYGNMNFSGITDEQLTSFSSEIAVGLGNVNISALEKYIKHYFIYNYM